MVFASKRVSFLSLIPGRMRVHLAGWDGNDRERIETRVRQVKGVESAQANPRTGNVLIRFDGRSTDADTLLRELNETWASFVASESETDHRSSLPNLPSTALRVGVRGILGHAVADSLWFGAGFLGQAIGLPLAGLGPLHVLMDIAVWTLALRSGTPSSHPPGTRRSPQTDPRIPLTSLARRTPADAASA